MILKLVFRLLQAEMLGLNCIVDARHWKITRGIYNSVAHCALREPLLRSFASLSALSLSCAS